MLPLKPDAPNAPEAPEAPEVRSARPAGAGTGGGVGVGVGDGDGVDRDPGRALPTDAVAQTLLQRAMPAERACFDELRLPTGALRPAWQRFAASLAAADGHSTVAAGWGEEFDRRVVQVAQRIAHDGVTHNVYADSAAQGARPAGAAPATAGPARPWSLQLLPQLIGAADWAVIEAGVQQRAELLQQMLADLYGPQRLLHDGLLPGALLLRHPGFLRPMVGARPPAGADGNAGLRLFVAAFDVARGADGRWWMVAQRAQGPSGLGYVLHNRLVVARQFPDAFRDLGVQRIASSYRRLLDTLEAAARVVAAGHTPRVVLLTPGPYSATYFEHAYLARYLGVPLVEGHDLTVRGQRLFMRTVEGLEPVHGVLRRLDDDWCDPLELRADSALGVPGLLQAVRAGTVVMANAFGSGCLESPAVQGFMPAIARRWLDQELLLPAMPTWWCGEAAAWQGVRQAMADKLVRSSFPLAPGGLAAAGPDIDADPDAWTVQSRMLFSRAPLWGAGVAVPRPALVRVYAIAEGNGRWHVLPGGMTRVSRHEDGSVSMQRGGTSLDTWVLTEGPVDGFSMLPQRLQVDDLQQRHRPVSSRTGENLFWLGRYTERTEQLVQLARATLLLIDADAGIDSGAPPALRSALSAVAVATGLAPPGVPTLAQSTALFQRAVLAGLGQGGAEAGAGLGPTPSIAFNLAALERASLGLRERLSAEHWGLIQALRADFATGLGAGGPGASRDDAAGGVPLLQLALPALDRLALQLAALTGAQSDRMTRDHGWRLLTVGRLLERLQGLATRLQAFVDAEALRSVAGVELLLELFDSLITFRARYQRHEDLLAVTDLLVLDSSNPRAFAGVLRRLRTELAKLPGDAAALHGLLALLPAPEAGAGLTLEALRGLDDTAIGQALRGLAASLQTAAAALAERIDERYFTPAHGADQRV